MSLPQGYKQLQYITSENMGPYILLNNGFDATDEVEIKTKIGNISSDRFLVSPTSWNTSSNRFALGGAQNSAIPTRRTVGFGSEVTGTTKYNPPIVSEMGQITTETYSNRLFTITGENINSTFDATSITFGSETDNLKLFYGYNATTQGTIYYWKHKKVVNGTLTLVEDLVPAERLSDNAIGMYDTVSNTFFGNSGTGSFTPGPYAGTIYNIKKSYYKKPSKLPSGFTELEYLQSTGTQYIDTGYAQPNIKCRVKTKVNFSDITSRYLIGPTSQSPNYFGRFTNGKFELNNVYTNMVSAVGTAYDLDYNCNGTNITLTVSDGTTSETLTANHTGATYSTNWNVFGLTAGTVMYILKGNIFSFQLYDNEILVRNLIPARRDSDLVLGMYDTVSGNFLTNSGTGTFIAGPRVELPTEYQELDYIQSSGTQWINPNATVNATDIVDMEFQMLSSPKVDYGTICGLHERVSGDVKYWDLRRSSNTESFLFVGRSGFTTETIDYNAKYKFHIENGTNLSKFYKNGVQVNQGTDVVIGSVTRTLSPYIFACNNEGRPGYPQPMKLFSFKQSRDDISIRNLIPAKRKSDNVVGMYDKCSSCKNLTDYILNITATGDGTQSHIVNTPDFNVNWKENTQYTFSFDCSNSGVTYSEDGNLIFFAIDYTNGSHTYVGVNTSNYQQSRISFTTNANKTISSITTINKHARWTGGTLTISNIQIEEGTTATSYEPFPFFTNQGTGTFIAGNPVYHDIAIKKSCYVLKILPDGYKPLEYIQSSGTLYIDTGIVDANGVKITAKVAYTNIDGYQVNGAEINYGGLRNYPFGIGGGAKWYLGRNNFAVSGTVVANQIYNIEGSTIKNDSYLKVDGETVLTSTDTTTLVDKNLYLFASNGYANKCKMIAYDNIKYYNSNYQLVRNFIPAKRISDNEIGMYDLVTNTFFENAGTGSFTAGPEISNYIIKTIKKSHYFIGG